MALTSLNQAEYEEVYSMFDRLVSQKLRYYTLKGVKRKTPASREAKNSSLYGSNKKLDFMLMYLKENPNQSYHAQLCEMSQSKVSEWFSFLSPVLEESLSRLGFMPQTGDRCQVPNDLSTDYLLVDVTERTVGRREDDDGQAVEYSGKKKRHTVKHLALSTADGYLLYLSPAFEGSVHDKTIWDDIEMGQSSLNLLGDLGFLGIEQEYPNAILPFKKPKKGQLTELQKQINQVISKHRVKIEHVFSSIKRLKIIQNKIRLKTYEVRDRIMAIAAALHNLRMTMRNHS
jgi:hypothetical protein